MGIFFVRLDDPTWRRAPQCLEVERLRGINSSANIILGNVRSQELRGRGICDCCHHSVLQSANVSHRIAEIRPDRLDKIIRTTAGVAHNARQAAGHRLVDNQSPGFFGVTWENQAIGRDIRSVDLRLVQEADKRSIR